MISKNLQKQLLDQVRYEWESEFYYMAMMAWCYNNDYDGFAQWFFQQAGEERMHGLKILAYLNQVGGELSIPAVSVPKTAFKGIEQIVELTLKHEQKITKLIHELVEAAIREHDHSTNNFLQWYVREQIEEESTARTLLAKVRRCKGAPGALLILENELAARGIGLPTENEEEK
jgi:ferritin